MDLILGVKNIFELEGIIIVELAQLISLTDHYLFSL